MSFLWRGRLYVVREVLGHWHERREWWAAAAARALHGDDGDSAPGARTDFGAVVADVASATEGIAVEVNSSAGGSSSVLDRERDVWRVEASAGRTFGNGVYDLCREPPLDRTPAAPAWRLVQVAD
jgi:hypothetical protein